MSRCVVCGRLPEEPCCETCHQNHDLAHLEDMLDERTAVR